MSKDDKKDPFADPFKKNPEDMNPKSHDDIFQKGNGGGGKKKPAPAVVDDDQDLQPEKSAPPPKVYPVKISNPKWACEKANFGETVKLSVDVDLGESHKDITRVTLTRYFVGQNGKKEKIDSVDVHVKDGKAEGEFTIKHPENSKQAEYDFVFTASHRDAAKEVESPKLNVSETERNLICEFDDHSEIKKQGYALVLKDAGGKVHSSFKAGDGIDKDGTLSFDFKKLDADTKYILEMQNDKAEVIEVIFSETKHGDWELVQGSAV